MILENGNLYTVYLDDGTIIVGVLTDIAVTVIHGSIHTFLYFNHDNGLTLMLNTVNIRSITMTIA